DGRPTMERRRADICSGAGLGAKDGRMAAFASYFRAKSPGFGVVSTVRFAAEGLTQAVMNQNAASPRRLKSSAVPETPHASVLVVEDEAALRELIAASLEGEGYAVAQAHDAADALSRLEGFAYDGLVVDLRLPDADGMDVLEAALDRYPDIRCVV